MGHLGLRGLPALPPAFPHNPRPPFQVPALTEPSTSVFSRARDRPGPQTSGLHRLEVGPLCLWGGVLQDRSLPESLGRAGA